MSAPVTVRASDLLGGRRPTFRLPVARLVATWSAGVLLAAGATPIALFAMLRPGVFSRLELGVALLIWIGLAAGASAVLAWGLSGVLAKPGNTLLALKRIDGEPSPVSRHNVAAAYDHLDSLLLRSAHERNGRISELVRARDNARGEGEALAKFFAGMSHELRTPLNAIIGYAMLLAEDAAQSGQTKQVRDLDRILQSGRQLLRLINNILDLTRLDAGEIPIDRAVIEVSTAIQAVIEDLADEAARSDTTIEAHVDPNARVMLGDATRLRQCISIVLGNLLNTHSGKTLRIDAVLASGDSARVEFRLTDLNGILAAAAVTAVEAEQAHIKGAPPVPLAPSALAMTVARRLSALMGGSLSTEPAANGSVLVISLPLSTAGVVDPDGPAVATVAPAPVAGAESGIRTVLVIDDDEPTIDLLNRWLIKQGYRVLAATNGSVGLELARTHSPDVIILDIIMPGRSGYEVLAELKADPKLRMIPVIVASSDDNRRLGLEAGAAEVMVKPLARRRLIEVLDVLGQQVTGDLLVVDDDGNAREIMKRYASRAGLRVRLASNGAEGMALARELTPSAIILDLCMPGTNGFAMMDALAEDATLKAVPVMVLSHLNISVAEHTRIRQAGHVFHPKSKSSPSQIVENIKMMVAQ